MKHYKIGTRVIAEIPTQYKRKETEKRSAAGIITQHLPISNGYMFKTDGYDEAFFVSASSVLGTVDTEDEA